MYVCWCVHWLVCPSVGLSVRWSIYNTFSKWEKETKATSNLCWVCSLVCFTSKYHWRATEALAILFQAMKLVKKLPLQELQLIHPVLDCIFFWAHPEQLFLGCLGSEDADVRARAIARIVALCKPPKAGKLISKRKWGQSSGRVFQLPKPNYNADHFSYMINWETEVIT